MRQPALLSTRRVPRFARVRLVILVLTGVPAVAFAIAGCGESDPGTPAACLGDSAEINRAMAAAPEPVRLDGGVAISECIPRNQGAGTQESVGRTLLLVATHLVGDRTDGGPDSESAALEAGYLVGALRRGAEDSDGIHSTLVDRVTTAASNGIESEPAAVRDAFDRGVEAGERDG